jgi:hypothetical protein
LEEDMPERLHCPLCKKTLTQDEYDKVLGTWEERKKALAHLQSELAGQKKIMAQEKAKLAAARRSLVERARQAVLEAQKKAKAKFEKERHLLQSKIERQFSRQTAQARKETERARGQLAKLKAATERQIATRVRLESSKLTHSFRQKLVDMKREVSARVKASEQMRTKKLMESIGLRDLKIQKLSGQVQELKRQMEQGTTPQIEGLLYEDNLIAELRKTFPQDKFIHTGKGGDIVHEVPHGKQRAGVIVYECKRVGAFSSGHVTQARQAKSQREADYAVLVTNARKKGTAGFFVDSEVIIVHPAGVIYLVGLLREALITTARLMISRAQKEEMVRQTLVYLESPEYRNAMKDTVHRTEDLYKSLTVEVQDHIKNWQKRYGHYRAIYNSTSDVGARIQTLLSQKIISGDGKISTLTSPATFPPAPPMLRPAE